MTTPEELAEYLNRHVPQEWRSGFPWTSFSPTWRPTVEQLSQQWLNDAEFGAFQLGQFLMTPDGELISSAVSLVMPPLAQEDAELVEAALKMAATAKTREQRKAAIIMAGVGVVLFAGAIFSGQGSNKA
jgi:hypothetical protein